MESTYSLRCSPARRSLKFPAGEHARHFLAFDPSISKHDRMLLYMELFAHVHSLIDSTVMPHFSTPSYLPEQNVELRVLTDPRHPAYGQIGLFARRTIPSNVVVTPYSGYIEIFASSCSSRTYTMGFGSLGDDYALDAEFVGNYGRFANDPRGIDGLSANLNAESRFTPRGEAYTALVSRRIINKGEEILMSYGRAHSLAPSPWVGLKGELLTQYRLGGIVPFPQLARKRPSSTNLQFERNLFNRYDNSLGLVEHWNGNKTCQNYGEGEGSVLPSISGVTCSSPSDNPNNNNDNDAEMQLLWECPQCGMWSIGSPTPARIDHCFFCRSPRLQRVRMVAFCCTSALTPADLFPSTMCETRQTPLASAETPSVLKTVDGEATIPLSSSVSASEGGYTCNNCNDDNHENDTNTSTNTNTTTTTNNNNKNHKGNNNSGNNGGVSENSLSPSTSESVDWPLNVPFLSWQVWDAAIPISIISKHARFETQENIFLYGVSNVNEEEQRHPVAAKESHNGSEKGQGNEQEEEQQTKGKKRQGRRPRIRRRKEELWQKEETHLVDSQQPEETKISSKKMGVRNDDAGITEYFFSVTDTNLHFSERCRDSNSNGDGSESTNSGGAPAFLSLQYLLRGITRRVFAGRSYHTGEVVGAVGGLIVPVGDRRCRSDGSVLRIPMKYFVPVRVRRELRAMTRCGINATAAVCSRLDMKKDEVTTLMDLLKRLEGLALVVTNELMFCPCLAAQDNDGENEDEEQKGDNFCGVVLNASKEKPYSQLLLELCNVCFVLTMDTLGCPYVAAVAVKDISIFEALLARIGS